MQTPRRGNLLVLLLATFLIFCGEELWSRFVPKYLIALGGSVLAVSAYGTLKDLLDAIYQFPGGLLTARLGAKASLVLFNVLAIGGYAIYALAVHAWVVVAALPLVMAWQSFSLPATFSVVGDSLKRGEKTIGFAYQSIVRRIPTIIAPVIGGIIIGSLGLVTGIRVAIILGIILALTAALVQILYYRFQPVTPLSLGAYIADAAKLDAPLKRLLVADCFVRFGQGIGEVFVVLYAMQVVGVSATAFGLLIALAMATSIAVYMPVAKLADRYGPEPWVTLTYGFFALFPLVLGLSTTPLMLTVAFILMGLREIGEPPRKSMIVDLTRPDRTSVDVGTYYLIRGIAVFPASLVGGLLWRISPHFTFFVAALIALIGMVAFALTFPRRTSSTAETHKPRQK